MVAAVIGPKQKGRTLRHNKMTAAGGDAARFVCILGYFRNQLALHKSEPFIMRRFLFGLLFYLGAENLAPSTKVTILHFFETLPP